jgi:hypothetical protein
VGSGDSSPRDMDKGYGQGIMPRVMPSRVNPPLPLALPSSLVRLVILGYILSASRQLST